MYLNTSITAIYLYISTPWFVDAYRWALDKQFAVIIGLWAILVLSNISLC